jgi:putative ABC transport system permease protein
MRPDDYLKSALGNLWRRKLRTFLTTFAVVIGATLVALMVSLGAGAESFLTAQLSAVSIPDIITVSPKSNVSLGIVLQATGLGATPAEVDEKQANPYYSLKTLTGDDLDRIAALPHVERVDPTPSIQAQWVKLEGLDKRHQVLVLAPPPYEGVYRQFAAGGPLPENAQGQAVVAYRYLQVWGLRSPEEALGRQISIRVNKGMSFNPLAPAQVSGRDYYFTVVGVLAESILATEVQVPYADAVRMARYYSDNSRLYTRNNMGFSAQVKVDDPNYINQVAAAIKALGDFSAETPQESKGSLGSFFAVVEGLLSVVGLIALGIAALGIINTLVMAIYERTREIGVMKAVGATQGSIGLLFTVEAACMGFLGGLVGLVLAWGLGQVINLFARVTFLRDYQSFNLSVFPWWLVLGVLALCTVIAVLAGLYPALRAARLDPIQALAYE